VLGFEKHERTRRGGRTWRMLVAGEGPENRDLGTSRRAAAAVAQSSPLERRRQHTRPARDSGEPRERGEHAGGKGRAEPEGKAAKDLGH
jgi:hypothetical protein